MISLPQGTSYAVHLRSPSFSGGKDWVGCQAGTQIHTLWGKTGQVNQKTTKPGNGRALDKIIHQKLTKGYAVIDEYHADYGWSSQQGKTKQLAPRSATPNIKPSRSGGDLVLDAASTLSWDF